MPPCASIHISQWAASPSRWPWAPSWTLTPASSSRLALAAARLVVALDAEGAHRLHAAQVEERVPQAVDLGVHVPLGAVEDRAGGEDARPVQHPGPLQLARREDALRVVGRVVQRRDAEGERGVEQPRFARLDLL